jgi:fructan beta-fructosidase
MSKTMNWLLATTKAANAFFIDRTKSGKTDFEKGFGKRHTAPRLSTASKISLTLLVDAASVELFADSGLTVMTDIFFPDKAMSKLFIKSATGVSISDLNYTRINSSISAGL